MTEGEEGMGVLPTSLQKISLDYFFMRQADEKASSNPMLVMLDEQNSNKYMRAVVEKGLGDGSEMEWLVRDLHEELKSWGYPGGGGNALILKSDGEAAIMAVREALGARHGGIIVPELPPKGEHQSNGAVEEASKSVREMAKVLKDQLEFKTGVCR
ncbi:hypothetical protein N9L68_07940 [bacterium]|nr:hypothetical protein [bacterium]